MVNLEFFGQIIVKRDLLDEIDCSKFLMLELVGQVVRLTPLLLNKIIQVGDLI